MFHMFDMLLVLKVQSYSVVGQEILKIILMCSLYVIGC